MSKHIIIIDTKSQASSLDKIVRYEVNAKDFIDALAKGKEYIRNKKEEPEQGQLWQDAEVTEIYERTWRKGKKHDKSL